MGMPPPLPEMRAQRRGVRPAGPYVKRPRHDEAEVLGVTVGNPPSRPCGVAATPPPPPRDSLTCAVMPPTMSIFDPGSSDEEAARPPPPRAAPVQTRPPNAGIA